MLVRLILLFILFQSFAYSQNSPHGKINFPCSDCHTTETWKVDLNKIKFNHDKTGFKLLGQHSRIKCNDCHQKLIFSKTPTQCVACHYDFHKSTLGLQCQRCHNFDTWKIPDFREKHNQTRFALAFAHKNLDCSSCHKSLAEFSSLPVECYGCHKKNYENVSFPNHALAKFSLNCVECHPVNALTWKNINFVHPDQPLKLDGKHAMTDCYKCHNGIFAGTPADCFSCHQHNFVNAKNPNHVNSGINHECSSCHTTNSWKPSTFDHNKTSFKLTGAHLTVECSSCHKGTLTGTPTDCYSCHQNNFASTTNPDHKLLGFPTNCEQCHTTNGWRPATFDHNKTNFALTGKHTAVQCQDCHKSTYKGTPTDCYSCHQNNYANALIPVHTVGYPYNCEMCHTTSGWRPSSFNHDAQYFKIYSGKHSFSKGRWKLCADCHLSAPNSFNEFSCTTKCHNNRTKIDNEHKNVSGYIYDNNACYSCHRNV